MTDERMIKMMKQVLQGLFYRLEALCSEDHPGWANGWRHRDEIASVKSRILKQVELFYPEDALPDVLVLTHDHTIYRADHVNGTLRVLGTMPRHLPSETEIMQVLEVL